MTEPVTNTYKFDDVCHCCGAWPIDQAENPWDKLPWIVTLKESGGARFLIDLRVVGNRDMFSGYMIDRNGSIGDGRSLTTGAGGRLNLHRTYFNEDLPS